MRDQHLRVLIVEDSVEDTFFIVRELQRGGFNLTFERVETAADMQTALKTGLWDLIISDYSMPMFSGPDALALYNQSEVEAPFIIVSGVMGEDRAVEMLKGGAHNYVLKGNLRRLVPAVIQELQTAQARRTRRQTEAATAYLASIVQSCEDAIIGETLDGTVVSWNAGAERLYGFNAVEMIGNSLAGLVPEDLLQEIPGLMQRVGRGEQIQCLETVRLRKGGAKVQVSVTLSPIRDANGAIIGASSVERVSRGEDKHI